MYEKKLVLFLFAASALLVACGGGGGSPGSSSGTLPAAGGAPASSPSAAGASTSSATPSSTTAASTTPAPATAPNTTTAPSSGTTIPTPASTPPDTGTTVADQSLKGFFDVVADQVVYIRRNRVIYLPVLLTEFESDSGIVDVASGSTAPPPLSIDVVSAGCHVEIDGTCGVQPPAAAPAAPIAAFGIRIGKFAQPTALGQVVANQKAVGRIAIDLTERNDSPGIGAGEAAEIMRFVIDKVEMSTSDTGELVSVKVQDGAQIHVYGRTAAGTEVRADIPAPSGTVRLLPVTQVPDSHGDTTSVFLFLDLETGFSQAGTRLAALDNIAGHFAMNVTLSSMQIQRPAGGGWQNLVGKPVSVNKEPPVSGGGIVGNAWIRMYPSR